MSMTENKAKKNLEFLERCYRVSKKGSALHEVLIEFVTLEDLVEAIQALEEIQQYRAIGLTPELIEAMQGEDMPNSLKSKLSSLRYKRLLTDEEYKELIKKLDGHDREIRAKAIDEFAEKVCDRVSEWSERCTFPKGVTCDILTLDCVTDVVFEIAEEMKGDA
jgi:hypothetical protein